MRIQGWFDIREYIAIIYHINQKFMTSVNSEKIYDKFNIYYVLKLLRRIYEPSLND